MGVNEIENKVSEPTIQPQLAGIGGWLMLYAISLIFGILFLLLGAVEGIRVYSESPSGSALGPAISAGMLLFGVYTTFQFFRKKHNAPALCQIFLLIWIIPTLSVFIVHVDMGKSVSYALGASGLLVRAVWAVIWISYFRKSERVKVTFIK